MNTQLKGMQFKELYNILDICVKSVTQDIHSDNIILMFINVDNIRFNSRKECVDIVKELNHGNFTLIFFCCDEFIEESKIENVKMFLDGIIEAYFIHVTNYKIIKQVLAYIASRHKQEDCFSFNFENINNIL